MSHVVRSLNVVPTFPYPPRNGGEMRAWYMYRHLAKAMEQTLVCRTLAPLYPEYTVQCQRDNLRVRSAYIPRPGVVHKVCKGIPFLLGPYPLTAAGWYFRDIERILNELIRRDNFDIIVVEHTWLAVVYWPAISRSKAIKVLDLHNLVAELLLRQAKILPPGLEKLIFLHDAIKMRYLESHIMGQADLVLVTSEREQTEVLKRQPDLRVAVVPNGVDCEAIQPLPFSNSREVLFVGSLNYLPNIDGVSFFAKEVLPMLRGEFSDLTFRVIGKNPGPEILKLDGTEGIEITGEVPDLGPYYERSALCVVPLRAGSGTRLKILEAMAYGRPVVSTSMGCEGIDAQHRKHLLIADDPGQMVDAIREVLVNTELAKFLVTNARCLVEKRYAWSRIAEKVYEQYEHLVEERRGQEQR